MGRRKTVRDLERQLAYARARAAAPPRQPDVTGAIRSRPRTPVKYASLFATNDFTVQASSEAIRFFGGLAALGLADAADDPALPRGGRPAQIKAMVGDSSPERITARDSNRPYIHYQRGTRGSGVQSNFTAPISADTATALKTRFKTVADAVKANLGGDYGRVSFEPERLPMVESGGL